MDRTELLILSAFENPEFFERVPNFAMGPVTKEGLFRPLKASESSQRLKMRGFSNRSPSKNRDQFGISGYFSRWPICMLDITLELLAISAGLGATQNDMVNVI